MASRTDQRARAVDRLAKHLLTTGLAEASVRQLAAAADVSDRMLLYYFEDKNDALSAAFEKIGVDFVEILEAAVPGDQAYSPAELIAATAELTLARKSKPYFRIWTETVALAARGEAPYDTVARTIAEGFLIWIEGRHKGNDPKLKRANAAMILAMIDGLALLEICTDGKRAALAAKQMKKLTYPT